MEWLDGAEWFRRITRWQAAKNHPSASISRGASGGDLPSSAWRRWDKLSWCTSTRGKALRRCDRSVQYSRREKMPQIVEKLLNGTIDYGVHPPITNFLLFGECRTKIDSSGKILLLHPPWFRRLTAHFSPKKRERILVSTGFSAFQTIQQWTCVFPGEKKFPSEYFDSDKYLHGSEKRLRLALPSICPSTSLFIQFREDE